MDNIFDYKDILSEIQAIPVITVREDYDEEALFTFAVPTFKRPETLRDTLDSIINQKCDIKYNIVISDNNSERDDSTEQLIISRYKDIHDLSYYKNSENIHSHGNWNRLVLLCKTKYMILIHDDDVLHEEFLSNIYKVLKAFPEVVAINAAKIKWDGKKIVWPKKKNKYKVIENTVYTNFAFFCFQAPSGCLFNTDVLKSIGGFNPVLSQSFDYANILTLCMKGKLILNYERPLVQYRVVNNASSDVKVQNTQLEEDFQLISQLGRILSLPCWYVNFVLWLKTKLRLRTINKRFHRSSFRGYKPGGIFYMFILKPFRWGYVNIWVNKMHCISKL